MAEQDYVEDISIYPRMMELAACVIAEAEARKLPSFCFAGIWPGDVAVFDVECEGDDGCHGQMWVRLVSSYPSSQSFPQPDTLETPCGSSLAHVLEVGIVRCVPVFGNQNGAAPDVATQAEATRLQMADMAAMRRAIVCCFGGEKDDGTENRLVLGTYTPAQTGGGVGGGTWQLTVGD